MTTIRFTEVATPFEPAPAPERDEWTDTSFAQFPEAIGRLRLPGPANGRYEGKHPILDEHGNTVGLLPHGETYLGYTFTCVYAGGCFWITNQTFGSTMHGGESDLSIVDESGRFLFSKQPKFTVVKSFGFGGYWPNGIKAFKLLDDDERLLYLTDHGFAWFNVRRRDQVSKVEFNADSHQFSGFAKSPKVPLLAIAFSIRDAQDPVDGEHRYRNVLRLYDLDAGRPAGEQTLPGDRETRWNVEFSTSGRQVRVTSDATSVTYEMNGAS